MTSIITYISLALNFILLISIFLLALSRNATGAKSLARKPREKTAKVDDEPTSEEVIGRVRIKRFQPESKGVLTGLTVLVADDDDTNIEVLIGMLEMMGLSALVVAKNGEEAVQFAKQVSFDIIYMDIQMPKKTGIDAAKDIRMLGKNRRMPIIPITGFSRIVNKQICKEAGMNGFLQKPVDFDKLKATSMQELQTQRAQSAA